MNIRTSGCLPEAISQDVKEGRVKPVKSVVDRFEPAEMSSRDMAYAFLFG
jgi:hypothetical protein